MNFNETYATEKGKFIKCNHPLLEQTIWFNNYHLFGVFLYELGSKFNWSITKQILREGVFQVTDGRGE